MAPAPALAKSCGSGHSGSPALLVIVGGCFLNNGREIQTPFMFCYLSIVISAIIDHDLAHAIELRFYTV